MSSTDWSSLKVVELRAELQSRGLPTKGVKADLVKRLTEADTEAEVEVEAEAEADTDAAQVNEPAAEVEPEESAPVASPKTDDHPKQEVPEIQEATNESQPPIDTNAPLNKETSDPVAAAPIDAGSEPTSQEVIAEEAPTTQPEISNQADMQTSVPAPDTVVDLQKRKRRSSTPPPSAKRARQEDERHVNMEEDVVDYEGGDFSESPEKKPINRAEDRRSPEKVIAEPPVKDTLEALEVSGEDAYLKRVAIAESSKAPSTTSSQAQDSELDVSGKDAFLQRVAIGRPSEAPQHTSQPTQSPQEDRFDTPQQWHTEASAEDSGPSIPSSHPPTSALYIRELMRPLRSEMVEEHIVTLVTPPGSEPDPNLVEDFYLDQIRTHAFVKLTSISAAKRVRAALHNQIWPNERNRKPLWVDFIPPDRMKEWIDEEESGGRGNAHRWEVVYEQDGDGMVAVHREAGPDSRQFSKPPPTGPAATTVYPGIEAAPRGPRLRGAARPPLDSPTALQTLAYPPLFYQPLGEDIAERRIRNMRSFYSQNPPRDLGKDYNRYTFENGDAFVDRGTEVFVGIRPPHREKEHQERLRRERLGITGASSAADSQSRRDDYRPPARPMVTDVDRYSTYDDGRRFGGDRRPRNRGFRGGGNRFRGEDPYRYRPGY
ncbi:Protein THO1 [Cytospora mali]|uniref:Protein THO1 n=1 Tax=Cytospora mali TaxID=578113 RepID=A0A194UTD8_CYTMA|nr:Protein THO1 [Valsa mali var. pyri (nom. inval.)]